MCFNARKKKNNNALTRQPLNEYELNIVCECMWFSVFLHSKCGRYTIKNVRMLHIFLNCCEFVIIFFLPLLHSNERHQQSVHNTDKTNRASFVQLNFSRLIKMFLNVMLSFISFFSAIYSFFVLIWCLWLALQRKLIHYLLTFFSLIEALMEFFFSPKSYCFFPLEYLFITV